jgi:hypothetical protein
MAGMSVLSASLPRFDRRVLIVGAVVFAVLMGLVAIWLPP